MGSSEHAENGHEPAEPDYKVGYRRPPIASRFKPGNPGNPTGRRKRRKTIGEIISDVMTKRIDIKERGRSRRITLQELILFNLGRAAAQGDSKAIRTLFALQERYQYSAETTLNAADLEAEDRKIIEEHLARFRSGDDSSKSKSGSTDEADPLNETDDGEPEGQSGG